MPAVITYANADGNIAAGITEGLGKELDRRQRLKDEMDMRTQAHEMAMEQQSQRQRDTFATAQYLQQQSQQFQAAQQQSQQGFAVGQAQFNAENQQKQFQMRQEAEKVAEERRQATQAADPFHQARIAETQARTAEIVGRPAREAAQAAERDAAAKAQINAQVAGFTKLREAVAASGRPDAATILAEIDGRIAMAQAGGKVSGDGFNLPSINPRYGALAAQDAARANRGPIADLLKESYGQALKTRAQMVKDRGLPEELQAQDAHIAEIERRYIEAVTGGQQAPAAGQAPGAMVPPPPNTEHMNDPAIQQQAVQQAANRIANGPNPRDPSTIPSAEWQAEVARQYSLIAQGKQDDAANEQARQFKETQDAQMRAAMGIQNPGITGYLQQLRRNLGIPDMAR